MNFPPNGIIKTKPCYGAKDAPVCYISIRCGSNYCSVDLYAKASGWGMRFHKGMCNVQLAHLQLHVHCPLAGVHAGMSSDEKASLETEDCK